MQFISFKLALDDFKSLINFNMLNNVIINHVNKIKALKIDVQMMLTTRIYFKIKQDFSLIAVNSSTTCSMFIQFCAV